MRASIASHELVQNQLKVEEEYWRKIYLEMAESATLLDAAAELAAPDSDLTAGPVGLKRLNEETFARQDRGAIGAKGRVLVVTIWAFVLSVLLVVWPTYWSRFKSFITPQNDDPKP